MKLLNAIAELARKLQPCKHLRVRETMACDAVCRECGQNIGFIQNWRDANKGNAESSEIHNDPSDPLSWNPRGNDRFTTRRVG